MIDEEFFRFAGCPVKKKTYICFMIPPRIEQSTKEERRAFVMEAWKCLHDCESCGKCRVLKGKDAETLYADYIEGERTYMDVTLDIRNNNYGR